MDVRRYSVCVSVALLVIAGCATSPDDESRGQAMEADIQDILSLSLGEDGKPLRCLSDLQYRGIRPLDEKHVLFTGRGDQQWVNVLRHRCSDLRHGSVLRVRSHSLSRICDTDRFAVDDWFEWPWYSRWPWHWGTWSTGMTCTLGKFYPVTDGQVGEIEAVIRRP
ncbi:MAG TPA: DUF6491 family protein [Woeseiaceae bacterium]|nr:DUF6491 family protein [Woeseiaceae bacterium]